MLRPILIHPDPRLKKLCDPVSEITGGVRDLITDMFETMYDAPGIGLAAPQVGVNARLLVMDTAKRDAGETPEPIAMLNPRIVAASEETVEYEEGCLSIPEIFAPVTRPAEVEVVWTDPDGAEYRRAFDGLHAVCVQHEIDHLNGRLFIDHLSALKRTRITARMRKLKRERERERG